MEIWNLRTRLCRIIADYRTQTSLQEGCNNILKADCVHLSAKLFREVRHCVRQVYVPDSTADNPSWCQYDAVTGKLIPVSQPNVESVKSMAPSTDPHPDAAGSDYIPEERPIFKIGFVGEDESSNVDYTESMRFKIPRRPLPMEESREALPSLIQ